MDEEGHAFKLKFNIYYFPYFASNVIYVIQSFASQCFIFNLHGTRKLLFLLNVDIQRMLSLYLCAQIDFVVDNFKLLQK